MRRAPGPPAPARAALPRCPISRGPSVPALLAGLVAFALLGLGGFALAGGLSRRAEPAPAAAPAPAEAPAAPAAPAAPPLFAGALPIALDRVPEGLASLSAQSCNACHGGVHDRWASSKHANAWNDPVFQEAIAKVGNATACQACHLPLANQHPRLATGYLEGDLSRPDLQKNPLWDATLMREGVTCAACHVREGQVIGARPVSGAPHPVAVSAELQRSELCASCHQLTWPEAKTPFYDTFGEWSRSAYAAAGVQCQDCHMVPAPSGSIGNRFAAEPSHAFEAPLERGLSVFLELPAPELQRGEPFVVSVRLQNSGAGHMIPTGSPFKRLSTTVEIVGADGKVLESSAPHRLGREVAEAPPWDTLRDERLAPGAEVRLGHTFTIAQKVPAQAASIRVRVERSLLGSAAPAETVLSRSWPLPML